MSPRPPALVPSDLVPLLGRLVKVRILTGDSHTEGETLVGWLVSVRSDRLELTLHVGARRWVRLPRVLAVERYTIADLRHQAQRLVDSLSLTQRDSSNSQTPNDKPASGAPLVKKTRPAARRRGKDRACSNQ